MSQTFVLIVLGITFAISYKIVDLIDEHNWINGKIGFILKYFFTLIVACSVYFSFELEKDLTPHLLSVMLFWILNNKFEYPSHVLAAFLSAIFIGKYLTIEYTVLALIGLAIYWILEFIVKRSSNKLIELLLYKSLARFLVVPLFLSVYFNNFNITIYTACGLLSMHVVRYLIKKEIIKINPQTIKPKGEN